MKTNQKFGMIYLLIVILLSSVNSCKNKDDNTKINNCDTNTFAENGKMGGCVLVDKINSNTVDVTDAILSIEESQEYSPFVKQLQTYGILLVGEVEVPNDFMIDVASALQQMFPQDSTLDLIKQHEILNNMLQYSAVIPVFNGEFANQNMDNLESGCSMCDIIMNGVNGQVMEVVEHLLHHISDIGLHYAYPNKWAFNKNSSEVYIVMKQAIDKGYYDVGSYSEVYDAEGCAIYNRLVVQEFAYWLISTYWNLQESYGPNENEWTIRNKQQLQEKLPSAYNLVETTILQVMTPPSNDILEKLKTYEP